MGLCRLFVRYVADHSSIGGAVTVAPKLVVPALLATALAASGCDRFDPPPPPPQTVVIRVNSDPGKPLEGAKVLFGGQEVGGTGEDGVAEIKLAGRDGETFDVNVACPEGFESPKGPVRVTLHRLSDPGKRPEYAVQCPPRTRTVVVAVRAEGVSDIPVTLLGREVARTDESGAAHVVLTLEPGEQFDLMLDTNDDRFADLRPQNPVASFGIGHQNDIFTFDQKFDRKEKKRRIYRGRAKPKGPVKISH
jgi:hypothetical protein